MCRRLPYFRLDSMEGAEALTIADTATRLGVTTQRVSQLLSEGTLSGPPQPEGRRAPKNATRVWLASLLTYEEQRAQRRTPAGTRPRGRRTPATQVESAAIHALKVSLDLARESLAEERQRSRRLTDLLAQTVAELGAQHDLADRAETIADGYSHALSELLAPTDIADL